MYKTVLVLIVILSAIFRVTNLNLIEFKADEGINLFLASRPVFGHPFPPIGIISSAGIPNPPFFNYLLLPIVYATVDPKTISFIIGTMNSLAIGFLFLLLYKYYSLLTAIFSSVLLALSPWSIIFSRKLWPPDFILPFMIAILYCLHKIVIDKKNFFFLPYTTLSLFLIQLYHPTLFFLLLLTAFLLIQKTKPNITYAVVGFFLGILPLLPYLYYQLQIGCADCAAFLSINEKLSVKNSPEMFLSPFQITGQGNFRFLMGDDIATFATNYPFVFEFRKLLYIPYLLLPVGAIIFWKRHTKLRFLVLATATTPIVYFLVRLEPFMHYFAVMLPVLFIFIGVAFSALFSTKKLFVKFFSAFLFVTIIAAYISFNAAFFDLLNKQKHLVGDYGTVFDQTEKSTNERFDKYRNDKNYKEMVVASYVPRASFASSPTLAKAVYRQKPSQQKNISQLDQWFNETPYDPRVENELLAYYTLLPKTPETMEMLRKKTKENQLYKNIYEEIYREFLAKNLKKSYRSPHFSIEYPSHWPLVELTEGRIMLKVDEYYMVINKDRSVEFSPKLQNDNNKKSKEVIKEMELVVKTLREGNL